MTPQEYFDKTVRHLLTQNKKSQITRFDGGVHGRKSISCAYRDDGGCRCAVGVHIPDELYKPEMEHRVVEALLENFPELHPHLEAGAQTQGQTFKEFLNKDLQLVHDSGEVGSWPRLLRSVAREHGLHEAAIDEMDRQQIAEAL